MRYTFDLPRTWRPWDTQKMLSLEHRYEMYFTHTYWAETTLYMRARRFPNTFSGPEVEMEYACSSSTVFGYDPVMVWIQP